MTTRYFLPLPAAAAEGPTGWTPPNYSILDTGFLDTEFLDTEFLGCFRNKLSMCISLVTPGSGLSGGFGGSAFLGNVTT